jgi:osmotically-inducible protein OsmY
VGAIGSTVYLRGEVESVEVADELIGLLGDIPGVEEVVDETTLAGMRNAEPGGG